MLDYYAGVWEAFRVIDKNEIWTHLEVALLAI